MHIRNLFLFFFLIYSFFSFGQSRKDYYSRGSLKNKKHLEIANYLKEGNWNKIDQIINLGKSRDKLDFNVFKLSFLSNAIHNKPIKIDKWFDEMIYGVDSYIYFNPFKVNLFKTPLEKEIQNQLLEIVSKKEPSSETVYLSRFLVGKNRTLFKEVLADSTLPKTNFTEFVKKESNISNRKWDFTMEMGMGIYNPYQSINVYGNKFDFRITCLAEIKRLNFNVVIGNRRGNNRNATLVKDPRTNIVYNSKMNINTYAGYGIGYDLIKTPKYELSLSVGARVDEIQNYYDKSATNYEEKEKSQLNFVTKTKNASIEYKRKLNHSNYVKIFVEHNWAFYKGNYLTPLPGNAFTIGAVAGFNLDLKKSSVNNLLGKKF